MTMLNASAKAALRSYGVSQAALARRYFTDGRWHGDACGCPDDRCIGHHHDDPDDCGCLLFVLDEIRAERKAAAWLAAPFETEDQAREAAHQVVAPEPGWSILRAAGRRELLTLALSGAGVEMGAYDERIAAWLAGWDDATCAVIAGWITRAATGGRKDGAR